MKRDLAIIAAAALLLMGPSLIWGPGAIDSAPYNYVWTHQFAQLLSDGVLYPRWLPRSFEGLGSPAFYFYPPLAYYLSGTLNALGLSTPQAINGAFLVLTFASGVSMYSWLHNRSSRPLIIALVYMAAPYHLADIYVRAALAESSAFVWLPLIALGIEAYPKRWSAPLLAVAFAGLILSHLPLALLTAVGLICPLALYRIGLPPDLRRAAVQGIAGMAGLALAAIYLVPALTLQGHISSDILWGPDYQPRNWSLLAAHTPVTWANRVWPVPMSAAAVALALGCAIPSWRGGDRRPMFWAGVATVTAAAGLALIPGLWETPLLTKVQFPWRILAITEFAALTALAFCPRPPRLAIVLALAISLAAYATTAKIAAGSFQYARFIWRLDAIMPDATEYLPHGFRAGGFALGQRQPDLTPLRGPPLQGPGRMLAHGLGGEATIMVDRPGRIVLRRFTFPAWLVTRDGRPVLTTPFGDGQLISFDAQPGRYELSRGILPQERLGEGLSLFGLAVLGGLIVLGRRRSPEPRG